MKLERKLKHGIVLKFFIRMMEWQRIKSYQEKSRIHVPFNPSCQSSENWRRNLCLSSLRLVLYTKLSHKNDISVDHNLWATAVSQVLSDCSVTSCERLQCRVCDYASYTVRDKEIKDIKTFEKFKVLRRPWSHVKNYPVQHKYSTNKPT